MQSTSPTRPLLAQTLSPTRVDNSLLLELPIAFRRVGGRLWVETQALNGLRCWADNFAPLTVCAPVLPDHEVEAAQGDWSDPTALLATRQIRLEPLPWGYAGFDSFRMNGEVKATLGRLIDTHRYLCFGNVGGFGAWGNIGVALARQRGRPYSLWFDNVAHDMPRKKPRSTLSAIKISLDRQYGKFETLRAIRHAGLGLFHGKTVFDAYAPLCPQPALVHDIHCSPADALSDAGLAAKLARQGTGQVLRIGYAGRAHAIKGPFDWIDTLATLARRVGPDRFEATWLGSGPALDEARARVEAAGLASCVRFTGHVSDRASLLAAVREFDVFMFCHLTPESPRCLIEALISCTPLLGYDSAYASDLVAGRGGARFVPVGDTAALADEIESLVRDRDALKSLIEAAATSRPIYNDQAVFEHRSHLIKTHLG